MVLLQAGVYLDVEACKTLALMHALRPAIVLENVLNDHVQAIFEYYKSVIAHNDYKMVYNRECLEMER